MTRTLLSLAILAALCGCGRPTEYVPVVVTTALPDEPPECRQREPRPTMKPFSNLSEFPKSCGDTADPTQCLNIAWARHERLAKAVDRRNAAREIICRRYLDAVRKGA